MRGAEWVASAWVAAAGWAAARLGVAPLTNMASTALATRGMGARDSASVRILRIVSPSQRYYLLIIAPVGAGRRRAPPQGPRRIHCSTPSRQVALWVAGTVPRAAILLRNFAARLGPEPRRGARYTDAVHGALGAMPGTTLARLWHERSA